MESKLIAAITGFCKAWWPAGKRFRGNRVDALQTSCHWSASPGRAVVNFFQNVSFFPPTFLPLGSAWKYSWTIFRVEIGRSLVRLSLLDIKKMFEWAICWLVSLHLGWQLIHFLTEEKFLNLSPNWEEIGYAAESLFDMVRAQNGSMADVLRSSAPGHIAEVYKQGNAASVSHTHTHTTFCATVQQTCTLFTWHLPLD